METLKCAGYIRVSTAIQVSEGESLTTQRQQIEDFVKQKGWNLTRIYSDEGISGAKIEHRTQFQQMIADAKSGMFSIIIFTKLSRFARNAREFLNMSYELEKEKVLLASIKESIDPTTKTGKMIAGILALFAEWEHETIREQMFENKMIRWKTNRSFLGIPPIGYRWNKATMKLEINEAEADIYRRVVSMYLEQGLAMRDVAIKLNSEGVTIKRINKDGKEHRRASWSSQTISYMLKNPCYYGHYLVNQVIYMDGKKGAGTKRTKDRKPASEAISFPIEPIISKPQWDRIQETTEFRKIKTKRIGEFTSKFFLRDVLVCDICGGKMNSRIGSQRKDGYINRYYVCYWAGTSKKNLERHRDSKCFMPYIPAEWIENRVWTEVLMMFAVNQKKAFGDIFDQEKRRKRIEELELSVQNLESDLKVKTSVRNGLYRLLEKPDINIDELHEKLHRNEEERLTIEGNLFEVKDKLVDLKLTHIRDIETADFLSKNKKQFSTLRQQIRQLSLPDHKLLVEAMLSEPIRIGYHFSDENHPEDGPDHPTSFYRLHLNKEIIKRFIDEGKLNQLDQDSRNYLELINKISGL